MNNRFRLFAGLALLVGSTMASPAAEAKRPAPALLPQFEKSPFFSEQICTTTNDTGVRIVINAPGPETFATNKPVRLILFALPNGNTIEQTIGKKTKPGDDWHFNIQHIGAQTRFLREHWTNENLVVAYLEATTAVGKSWPTWRKKHGDKPIPEFVAAIKSHFRNYKTHLVLSGHSGGGSMIFGYINALPAIPDEVERIAFLDANYGYETELHKQKLVTWLEGAKPRRLVVLAYHDNIALLNGKTFVSAAGGTWGKSHLMKTDFDAHFKFEDHISPEWENYSSEDGRVKFFLRENPEKKILHTVQVELNGFIHALAAGTPRENKGYRYFGDKVYDKLIQAE